LYIPYNLSKENYAVLGTWSLYIPQQR